MSTFAIVPFFENMAHDYPCLKSIELIQSNRSKTMVQKRKNCIRSIPYLGYLVLPGKCELDSVVIPSGLPSSLQSLELRFLMVRLTQIMNGIRIRELAIDRVHMSDEDFFIFRMSSRFSRILLFRMYIAPTTVHDRDFGDGSYDDDRGTVCWII